AVQVLLALARAALQRKGHVAQQDAPRVQVPLARRSVKFAGLKLVEREAQHVGGGVYPPVFAVYLAYSLVIGKQRGQRAVLRDALRRKRGSGGAEYQLPGVFVSEASLFPGHAQLDRH